MKSVQPAIEEPLLTSKRSVIRPMIMRRVAVALWVMPMIVISIMVAHKPWKRSVTSLYHEASQNWRAGKDLYQGPGGMNYLPHFAILFTPFRALPPPAGDILWRCAAAALLAGGIYRLARRTFANDDERTALTQPSGPVSGQNEVARAFLLATIFAFPLALGALRNGQANAMFAALTVQAAASIAEQRWSRAQIWIILAVAVKPLGIVLLLLAPFVYAPLRWRTVIGLAALAIFPFLFGKWDYVMAQHRAVVANLESCAVVTEHRFADINGIIRTFGGELPASVSKLARLLAGAITLCIWWLGARRLTEPARALWLLALGTGYLMVFNPMNEANSYVIAAPAFGLWGAIMIADAARGRAGWVIGSIALSMGLLPNILRPLFGNHFALFWHPLMTLVIILIIAQSIFRDKEEFAAIPATS